MSVEWRKCSLHPDVDPEAMWGCPDCLASLRTALAAAQELAQQRYAETAEVTRALHDAYAQTAEAQERAAKAEATVNALEQQDSETCIRLMDKVASTEADRDAAVSARDEAVGYVRAFVGRLTLDSGRCGECGLFGGTPGCEVCDARAFLTRYDAQGQADAAREG